MTRVPCRRISACCTKRKFEKDAPSTTYESSAKRQADSEHNINKKVQPMVQPNKKEVSL